MKRRSLLANIRKAWRDGLRKAFALFPQSLRFAIFRSFVECDPAPDKRLVLKIADAVRKSLDDPAIKGKLEPQGVIAGGPRTPEEFSTFLKAELTKYSTLVKELGVRAE